MVANIKGVLPCFQDAQDAYLEQQREIALTAKISVIQKSIRMWAVRRRFVKMRSSCTTIQSRWRGYAARKRFLAVSTGRGFFTLCFEAKATKTLRWFRAKSFIKRSYYIVLNCL